MAHNKITNNTKEKEEAKLMKLLGCKKLDIQQH